MFYTGLTMTSSPSLCGSVSGGLSPRPRRTACLMLRLHRRRAAGFATAWGGHPMDTSTSALAKRAEVQKYDEHSHARTGAHSQERARAPNARTRTKSSTSADAMKELGPPRRATEGNASSSMSAPANAAPRVPVAVPKAVVGVVGGGVVVAALAALFIKRNKTGLFGVRVRLS